MKAWLWAVLAMVTWGIVPLIEKMGLTKFNVGIGLVYRCVGVMIGLLFLLVFKWAQVKESVVSFSPQYGYFVLGGLMASIVGQIFFYHALKGGEASLVVPIAGAYPLITFILGILFLGESVTLAKTGGIFFVILGISLLR